MTNQLMNDIMNHQQQTLAIKQVPSDSVPQSPSTRLYARSPSNVNAKQPTQYSKHYNNQGGNHMMDMDNRNSINKVKCHIYNYNHTFS